MQSQPNTTHPALIVKRAMKRNPRRTVTRILSFALAAAIAFSLIPMATASAASLKEGMSGTAVKALQQQLVKRGYLSGADGKYGKGTTAAVKLFQQHAGLTADGVAGSATQDALSKISGDGKTNLTLKVGSDSSQVTILQKKLAALGYLSISSYTAHYGTATKDAVVKFQKAAKLTADGVANPKTLIKVYSAKASGGSSTPEGASLKKGMSGATVKTLQTHLVKRGYLKSADGKFGSGTATAVKLFQKQAGLKADGVAGATTQNLLYKLSGTGKTNQTLKSGQKSSEVTILQKRLEALGYLDTSTFTTTFDTATKNAVIKFQKKAGLTADGAAGPMTLIRLYSPSAPVYMTKGEKVVAAAKQYLGKKYVYGTAGPSTFDCSGLVYYVYKHHFGITVPRSSKSMINAGVAVEGGLKNAKPGDILCFGNTLSTVGHVAFYIGNNQYLHAPQTGDVVKIETLSQKRINTCVAVRRIFTSD